MEQQHTPLTIEGLKSMKLTQLRKAVKKIIVWNSMTGCTHQTILNEITRYASVESPKHNLFVQNLKSYKG